MRLKCPVSGLRFWADEAIIKGIQDPNCRRGMANIFASRRRVRRRAVVALYCKRRGFYLLLGGTALRRAEHLPEEVIARVPVRQEVLLFPLYNKSMEKKVV